MKGLVTLIALEMLKDQDESLKTSSTFNLIESMLVYCIIKQIYDNLIDLKDEETFLILISSEYARIHKRRI